MRRRRQYNPRPQPLTASSHTRLVHTCGFLFLLSATQSPSAPFGVVAAFQLDCSSTRNVPSPTVASNGYFGDSEWDSNAPTPAPSRAQPCDTQTSNARGYYTSVAAPCTFKFHAANVPSATPPTEREFIDFRTSDLCSEENTIGSSATPPASFSVMEYVTQWPDECVGDFQRCYSLEYHSKIMEEFLCSKEWYSLPVGTTHISVDCTSDKALVDEAKKQKELKRRKSETKAVWNTYQMKFVNLAIVFTSCIAGLYMISQWIVKPLSGHGKYYSAKHTPLPTSQDTQQFQSSIMMTSLPFTRHSSSLSSSSETASTSLITNTTGDTASSHASGGGPSLPTTWLRGGSHHRRNGSSGSYGSTEENSTPNPFAASARSVAHTDEATTIEEASHLVVVMDEDPSENHRTVNDAVDEVEQFNRQIPADFDAVPIVLPSHSQQHQLAEQDIDPNHASIAGLRRTEALNAPFYSQRQQSLQEASYPLSESPTTDRTVNIDANALVETITSTTVVSAETHPLVATATCTNVVTNITEQDQLEYTTIPFVEATPLQDHIVVHAEPSM